MASPPAYPSPGVLSLRSSPLSPSPRTGDEAIRGTDDDAALSRFSCTEAGYLDDPFARYFIRHPVKRPPLINQGTFVRTWAMDKLVDAFLDADETNGNPARQILSVGAGTDTRFFRLWRDRQAPSQLVRYVEVDFPETTARKAQIITRQPGLTSCLGSEVRVEQGGTSLRSRIYNLVPGDLRSFPTHLAGALLSPTPASALNASSEPLLDPTVPTLVLAECVFVYLPPAVSNAILGWAARVFSTALACIYDPVALQDAFGKMMVRNLKERSIVLHGVQATPSLQSQADRLVTVGFQRAAVRDVRTLRRTVLPRQELERISSIEHLDEIEELELVLSHYAVAWGSNGDLFSTVGFD